MGKLHNERKLIPADQVENRPRLHKISHSGLELKLEVSPCRYFLLAFVVLGVCIFLYVVILFSVRLTELKISSLVRQPGLNLNPGIKILRVIASSVFPVFYRKAEMQSQPLCAAW